MKTDRQTPNTHLFRLAHHAIKNGMTREAFLAQFRPAYRKAAAKHFDHLTEDDRTRDRTA